MITIKGYIAEPKQMTCADRENQIREQVRYEAFKSDKALNEKERIKLPHENAKTKTNR